MPYKKRKNHSRASSCPMENQRDPPPETSSHPPKQPPISRKSKQKPLSKKQMALVQQKLALLSQNLRPVPVPPPSPKTLDSIAAHQPLFRSLGLLDFASLRLDGDGLRRDLLAELIAHYDRDKHHSLVRGLRLKLSRADLGRALSLPRPPAIGSSSGADFDAGEFGGAEAAAAVLWGFIMDRMVFLDDAAILPPEVMAANALLKDGKPNRVDWAGIMWALTEREILAAPENGTCYYAAHLQCLMKHQRPVLFEETGNGEELEQSEAATVTVDDSDGDGDGEEEAGDVGIEKGEPGLSLGICGDVGDSKKSEGEEGLAPDGDDAGVEQVPDGDDAGVEACFTESMGLSKEEPEEVGRMEGVEHYTAEGEEPGVMKVPDMIEDMHDERHGMENEEPRKAEENNGKKVDDGVDDELVGEKFPTLERLTSSDYIQVMGTTSNLPFGLEQSNGDFLAMGDNVHNNSMGLDMGPGGSFLFENEHKRGIDEIDDHANGFHPSHQEKRFRSDQPWEHTPSVTGFEGCMDQVQHFMGKAHLDLIEKEKAYMNVQTQIHYLSEVLQQKDVIIQALEKTRMEQMQKREMEATRFNHDVKTLSNIVFGCKRALTETHFAFSEYRRKFPMHNEVLQSEGVGTSVKEDGNPLSTKEEEMRQTALGLANEFYKRWSDEIKKYDAQISTSATKLAQLKEDMVLLKEKMSPVNNQNHG